MRCSDWPLECEASKSLLRGSIICNTKFGLKGEELRGLTKPMDDQTDNYTSVHRLEELAAIPKNEYKVKMLLMPFVPIHMPYDYATRGYSLHSSLWVVAAALFPKRPR